MKKGVHFLLALLTVVSLLIGKSIHCMASETIRMEPKGVKASSADTYNIILLIDKSGSMNGTDANRLALSAGCQFVDQLCNTYNEMAAAANVGAMTFSQTTEVLTTPISLDSDANAEYLKSQIKGIEYLPSGTGGTDLGVAVYDAVQMLKKWNTEDNKNMIVLFTDGYSDNVLDEQAAADRLNEAFRIADELECEIYVVGLNRDNTIEEQGKEEIRNIANTTQRANGVEPISKAEASGEAASEEESCVNYLITSDMGEIREFYGRIYAKMIGGVLEIVNGGFSITGKDVLEADVTIYADSEIYDVVLKEPPDGSEKEPDGESCFIQGDDFYKVVKIMNPATGNWGIEVSTENGSYVTYVVRFIGIELAINAEWGEPADFKTVMDSEWIGRVTVTPMFKGDPYKYEGLGDELYTAEFEVTEPGGTSPAVYELGYNKEDGTFTGYFPINVLKGSYHIEAVLANDRMYRTAVHDLNVNIESAIDKSENDAEKTSQESNTEKFIWHWYYLGIALILVFSGTVTFVFLNRRLAREEGSFVISAQSSVKGKIENTFMTYPRGKTFSLWQLVDHMITVQRDMTDVEKKLCEALKQKREEIAQIKLVLCREGTGNEKKRVYKLSKGTSMLYNLSSLSAIYRTPEFTISLQFVPQNKTAGNKNGFEMPSSETTKEKKGGRRFGG